MKPWGHRKDGGEVDMSMTTGGLLEVMTISTIVVKCMVWCRPGVRECKLRTRKMSNKI